MLTGAHLPEPGHAPLLDPLLDGVEAQLRVSEPGGLLGGLGPCELEHREGLAQGLELVCGRGHTMRINLSRFLAAFGVPF